MVKQRRNRRNTHRKRRQSRRGAARKHRFFTRRDRKQRGGNWAATNGKTPLYAIGETIPVDGDDVGAARMARYSEYLKDKDADEVGVPF
jgi:hypothetical protein